MSIRCIFLLGVIGTSYLSSWSCEFHFFVMHHGFALFILACSLICYCMSYTKASLTYSMHFILDDYCCILTHRVFALLISIAHSYPTLCFFAVVACFTWSQHIWLFVLMYLPLPSCTVDSCLYLHPSTLLSIIHLCSNMLHPVPCSHPRIARATSYFIVAFIGLPTQNLPPLIRTLL